MLPIKNIKKNDDFEDTSYRAVKKVLDNLNKIKSLINTNISYMSKISRKASIEDFSLEKSFKKSILEHERLLLLLSKIEVPDNN